MLKLYESLNKGLIISPVFLMFSLKSMALVYINLWNSAQSLFYLHKKIITLVEFMELNRVILKRFFVMESHLKRLYFDEVSTFEIFSCLIMSFIDNSFYFVLYAICHNIGSFRGISKLKFEMSCKLLLFNKKNIFLQFGNLFTVQIKNVAIRGC